MKIHIVQKGETLWNIAQKYGVNFDELKKLNAQLSNPEMIMPGMKIKVPGHSGGGAKEKPIHHHPTGKKEMPKAEHPFLPKKEAPMPVAKPPKEKPKKEKPHHIYQPVMPQPQPLPEIDINNYYMMNMQQMQTQQMAQPAPPKEKPVHHHKEESSYSPEMPIQQPMYGCYPVPQPCFDPCYPYPQPHPYQGYMMPQVQGAMTSTPMMPFHTAPMASAPMTGYGPQTYWEWEESLDMHHTHYAEAYNQVESSSDYQQMGMMPGMAQPYPFTGMPAPGFQQPMMPQANFANPVGDCGCGNQTSYYPQQPYGMHAQPMPMHQGQMYQGYPPMGTAMPPSYAMPMRHENGEEDE
ncbi:SafA/ExsA family spore coat assembly protein [Lederbergia galactosidilytica]|uniref:SafA/ExsA family spore coat assembly protein n=1 Tax=Lederbergia galactosidilytica TaxID=217031 RepID=UPI0007DB0C05|nr:SafA/ExsA family spore coat assembly protein [Lederbergia galactosidilytica]